MTCECRVERAVHRTEPGPESAALSQGRDYFGEPEPEFCHRASFGMLRVNSHPAKAGNPSCLSLPFTRTCISCAEISGNVNRPASKQCEQYIVLFEPSAFVPPPLSSRRSGMPQDWQFLYEESAFIVAYSFHYAEICNHKMQSYARTTILGTLVLANRALSAAQLIRLTEPLGLSASNLKSHLTRMVNEGSLARRGPARQATYSPSAAQNRVVTGIKARLVEDSKRPWDNTWYMLTFHLPTNRAERDRLRASLWFDGFRPVNFGCFVRPAWPQPWAQKRIHSYLFGGAFSIRGEIISARYRMENLYDLRGLDSEAWELASWLKRQQGVSITPRAAFLARMEAGSRVARLVGHDPRLPPAIWGKRRGMAEVILEYRKFERIVSDPAQCFLSAACR